MNKRLLVAAILVAAVALVIAGTALAQKGAPPFNFCTGRISLPTLARM